MSTAIKERPILFSGEMVRAILDGRKTQTRRIVKGKGTWSVEDADDFSSRKWPGYEDEYGTWTDMKCPYGQPGDRLWARESFSLVNPLAGCELNKRPEHDGVRYKATWSKSHASGWKPSIHMPRWASRITLEIAGVRVERLNDISEEDAIAEGWPGTSEMPWSPRGWFQSLWQSINGEGSWEANPWVWVIKWPRISAAQTSAIGE